jgi:AraC family transcriptional regulator
MVADQSRIYYSARTATLGGAQVASLSCRTDTARYEGTAESDIYSAKDLFATVVDGEVDESAEILLNGRRATYRVTSPGHSIVLPRGSHLVTKRRGRVSSRYFLCEIEHDAFARLVDPDLSEFELRQYYGPTALDPSIVRRLSSACEQADSPLAYIEALATIFIIDLYRAYSGRALPAPKNPNIGDAKFRSALDFIEENLHREIGLAELASLLGFSVAHFSHAFKAAFGLAPYRYIMRRRIARAKVLLRNSDATIASIAASVGFSSQSRFTQIFARGVGDTPSVYRTEAGKFTSNSRPDDLLN